MLQAIFREIEVEQNGEPLHGPAREGIDAEMPVLPALDLPPSKSKSGMYVVGPDAIRDKIAELVEGCGRQGNVLGLDCEWEPSLGGKIPNPVATVQLSLPDGTAALFHLQRGQRNPVFPGSLRALLEDPSIMKVREECVASLIYLQLHCVL